MSIPTEAKPGDDWRDRAVMPTEEDEEDDTEDGTPEEQAHAVKSLGFDPAEEEAKGNHEESEI